jgi:hypothetical protein
MDALLIFCTLSRQIISLNPKYPKYLVSVQSVMTTLDTDNVAIRDLEPELKIARSFNGPHTVILQEEPKKKLMQRRQKFWEYLRTFNEKFDGFAYYNQRREEYETKCLFYALSSTRVKIRKSVGN